MTRRHGLLLPHFGEHADRGLLVEGIARAEALGFDSVWVRDHLVYAPHPETDGTDATFHDPLLTLTLAAASSSSLALGTSALVPLRHPLWTAKLIGDLSALFDREVIVGLGAGGFDHEFAALGLESGPRSGLVEATREICTRLWSGDRVDHDDGRFAFSGVTLQPRPAPGRVRLWHCGSGQRTAERAGARYEGWLPARITLPTLRERIATVAATARRHGRPRPGVGLLALSSIDRDPDRARGRIPLDRLLDWANHHRTARTWARPASGRFETAQDLEGMFVAGDPERFAASCERLHEAGVEHLVFDLRPDFGAWLEQLELIGTEVLPALRAR